MSKSDPKKVLLPHSRAKLELYKSYLKEYLPILGNSKFIDAINIFDIFCGTGIYDDGNIGSPLIAAACILDYERYFEQKGEPGKPVKLFINDFDSSKVNSVTDLIKQLPLKNCSVKAFNLDASQMFDIVAKSINEFSQRERSLVFIDPYGYSKIDKNQIYTLLKRKRSEIILFLPVAHMRRFTEEALTDFDKKAYENLRKFIFDFFDGSSRIINEDSLDIFEYIEELRKAFSFKDEFYTASHYIERNKANYYALFFIGHHIYGLEKFIEAKWMNDSLGRGFNQSKERDTLFGETLGDYDKYLSLSNLERIFKNFINENEKISNKTLYEFTLRNQFKPSHMNELLREYKRSNRIIILDKNGIVLENVRGFGLTYNDYKANDILYLFKKE